MQHEQVITLPVLDQEVPLGSLYDARTGTIFAGVSVWDSETVNKTQVENPNQVQNAEFSYTKSLEESRKKFGLSLEASLSLDLGIVSVSGSAKYLNEKKSSLFEARLDVSCTVARQPNLAIKFRSVATT